MDFSFSNVHTVDLGVSLLICVLLMAAGCFITAFVTIKRNRMLVRKISKSHKIIILLLIQCIFNESLDNTQANITSTSQEF